MNISPLAYEIIDECKCGPEEFFVLVSSIYPGTNDELELFLETLSDLIKDGIIEASLCGSETTQILTLDALKEYVRIRTQAGESLDEYPSVCKEYCFFTTEKGLTYLREEDIPIKNTTS